MIENKFETANASLSSSEVVACILLNFVFVKGWRQLPFYIWIFAPLATLCLYLISIFIFEAVIYGHESSKQILWLLEQQAKRIRGNKSFKKKIYLRQVRAQASIKVGAGFFGYRFYIVKNSTAFTFYNIVVDFTANALLTFPFTFLE
jgi:hypothetical protein